MTYQMIAQFLTEHIIPNKNYDVHFSRYYIRVRHWNTLVFFHFDSDWILDSFIAC